MLGHASCYLRRVNRWARRAASAGCLTPGWKPVLDVVPVGAGCLDHAMLDREVSQVGRCHGVSAPWRLAGNLSPAPLRCPSVPCEADWTSCTRI